MSRFDELTAELAAKGATDPAGLARHIGMRKYGAEGFKALQAAGRARRRHSTGTRSVCPSCAALRAAEPTRAARVAAMVANLPVLPLS
jgi:hypothetical protein